LLQNRLATLRARIAADRGRGKKKRRGKIPRRRQSLTDERPD